MKKIPYGISNYEELINDNYYYVDKTKYIEQLENLAEKRIMFLRPRKFGKTLFTSTLECYYDIKYADKFDKLFGETYIGNNPTKLKNSYHVLRFNFSGIDTDNEENTILSFKYKTISSIKEFIQKYELDFFINESLEAEIILNDLLKSFKIQKNNERIYVLIDEYDHFANELLGFKLDQFKQLISKNGKVRKWYEILKEGTESVVDRIFITGVAPITLDSLTSGFNICSDKTMNKFFNEMLGFTEEELKNIMKNQNINDETISSLIPLMRENYDGYKFSSEADNKIYNSNMCLYFLNEYIANNTIPKKLIDMNIASDYAKLANMLNLCHGDRRLEILEKTVSGEGIVSEITQKFNPEIDFGEREFISLLFYLGYLTITDDKFGFEELQIPNLVMKDLYSNYFIEKLNKLADFNIESNEYGKILEEIALTGKIEILTNMVHKYLNNLSNRDFQKFDEKYIKLIFYCILRNLNIYKIKSEPEINRNYPDLMLIPRDSSKEYYSVLIEFKYLQKGNSFKIKEKQKEARAQILRYGDFEEIKDIQKLKKYTIVIVNDEIHVAEV